MTKLLPAFAMLVTSMVLGSVPGCATAPPVEKPRPPGPPSSPVMVLPEASSTAAPDASAPAPGPVAARVGRAALLATLDEHPEITTLDAFVPLLPRRVKESFVLKHGIARRGERGHLVETRISQSADPDAPRVVVWDDADALFVSYNGGTPRQTNENRLDVLSVDPSTRGFLLDAVDFERGKKPRRGAEGCAACHGPASRPIFSMYPDWPGFYGSDNDELTSPRVAVQVAELADLTKLRARVATLPRYSPLFSEAEVRERFGVPMWSAFPYRPDTSTELKATSRAFAFRPGLRLGIVLARLQARALVARVKAHPAYGEASRVLLATLLACPLSEKGEARVSQVVNARLHEPAKLVGRVLHARQAWRLFGLEIRDVDIRYSYGHEGYGADDASKNPMGIGYLGTYWASYFDGSATLDELVAHLLVQELGAPLTDVAKPHGLTTKYRHLEARFRLDARFFEAMDALSLWIPTPYPKMLDALQHREGFGPEHARDHAALCAEVVRGLE